MDGSIQNREQNAPTENYVTPYTDMLHVCNIYLHFANKSMANTPWKINMDHNHGGLEDHFPF